MEKIILVNAGADAWTVTLQADSLEFDLAVPADGSVSCYASAVKVGATFENVVTSSQYVRDGLPLPVITETEAPFFAAYLILGAMSIYIVFQFVNPFKHR